MSQKTILLVEDDPDGQEFVAASLMHLFDVITADNGAQASAILQNAQSSIVAVIIDLAMPEKDGWQLLDEILTNAATRDIPCVAITAFHTSKLRQQALETGFASYFPKPIDAAALAETLEQLVENGIAN